MSTKLLMRKGRQNDGVCAGTILVQNVGVTKQQPALFEGVIGTFKQIFRGHPLFLQIYGL
jgi:hypothetical protein